MPNLTDHGTSFVKTVSLATKVVEWVIRITVGLLVFWQVWLLWVEIPHNCLVDENLLGPESRWM